MKTLESPLDSKEIKPINPKENQPWIFIGRTDAEAEAPTLWPPNMKSWLIGKDPDAGKDWGQEKGATEDDMVGWYHWLRGHEFQQTPGDTGGQRTLVCCSPWSHRESDTTEWLKNNNMTIILPFSSHMFPWHIMFWTMAPCLVGCTQPVKWGVGLWWQGQGFKSLSALRSRVETLYLITQSTGHLVKSGGKNPCLAWVLGGRRMYVEYFS